MRPMCATSRRAARSSGRRRPRLALSCIVLATCAVAAACPPPAEALVARVGLTVPGHLDVFAVSSSADPSGTADVSIDGSVVASGPLGSRSRVAFRDLSVTPGRHAVLVSVTATDGAQTKAHTKWITVWDRPGVPSIVSPAAGTLAGRLADVTVRVGAQTTRLTLEANGRTVREIDVRGSGTVVLRHVPVGAPQVTLRLVASSPGGRTASETRRIRRLDYPSGWRTCIVIDKSDFRLYWVRDEILVKAYPIAHGRNGWTPPGVWRIGAKYVTDSGGIYGPRKMRLFRRQGSGWAFTRYGIHGTNQPWVIGTMASHGCIRMFNADVLELWPQVPLYTLVLTRE
jgi:lipoprotein-anchoring transpeptidase ErfK/SrfK